MSYYVHSWQGLYFSFSLSLFFFKNLIVLYTLPIYGYQYILVPYQNTKEWLKKRTQMHMHLTLRSLRRRFFFKNLIILYTLPIYGYQYILVPYQNTKEGLKKRTQMHMHLTLRRNLRRRIFFLRISSSFTLFPDMAINTFLFPIKILQRG